MYYDGKDYGSMPSSVTDKAGTATNATITNTNNEITFDSTYKAWTFGGTDTRTSKLQSSALPSTFSGNQVHSVALWFKCDVVSGDTLFSITQPSDPWEDSEKVISVRFNDNSGGFRYLFWSNDIQYHGTDANISKNIWYHLCVTYSGGGGTTENKKLYLNGNEIHHTATSGSYFGNNLALPSGSVIRLGSRVQETTRFFGSIANFRLFNRALTADEVWQLYAYQKDYFQVSPDALTFKNGRLGIGTLEPRAVLDVRDLYARGSVVQVVQGIKTNVASTSSTGFVDTGLEVTITPKSSSSKILVSYAANISTDTSHAFLRVVRNGTPIAFGDAAGSRVQCTHYVRHMTSQSMESYCMEFLDSPSTMSSVTYKLQYSVASINYTVTLNRSHNDGDNVYYGRGVSTITAKEIAQ